jgi:DNA polymerase-3 subunit epsilon
MTLPPPQMGCVHQNSNSRARESHESRQRKIRQLAGNDSITIDGAAKAECTARTIPVCRSPLSDAHFSDGKPQRPNRFHVLVGAGGDAEDMNTAGDFVVVDVETSGFDPAAARALSVAALTLTADGSIEHSMYTLLNPGVDPGPTHIHGITPTMLAGQPCYADIAEHLAPLLRGRILVAHNAAFDYAFLAAEARRCDTELPVTSVLCTYELAALLDLGLGSLSLAALAHHWNIPRARPHDALDDAQVLAGVLRHALVRATELEVILPIRSPATLPPAQFHEAAA